MKKSDKIKLETKSRMMLSAWIVCFVFSISMLLSSCVQNPADFIPTGFGEWEGCYLYYGNQRMKTSGEDLNYLISEIVDGETAYQIMPAGETGAPVFSITDTYYDGDYVYMCAWLGEIGSRLLKYNLPDKTYETVYASTEGLHAVYIKKFFDDAILLTDGGYADGCNLRYFIIGLDGRVRQKDADEYKDYQYAGDYIISKDGDAGEVSYRKWADKDFKTVQLGRGYGSYLGVTLEGSLLYITRLNTYRGEGISAYNTQSLYIYDLVSETLHTVFEASDIKTLSTYSVDGYYMVYDDVQTTYLSEYTQNGKKYTESIRTSLGRNCVLYKLDENYKLVKVYEFPNDKEFQPQFVADGSLYLNAVWINNKGKASNQGHRYGKYKLDLSKLKLRKSNYNRSALVPAPDPKDSGWVYGKYIFYETSRSRNRGFMSGNVTYYYLNRYDTLKRENSVMQYCSEEGPIVFDEKFSYKQVNRVLDY